MNNRSTEGAAPLLKALQELAPLIAQHRARFDRDRHLPDEVFNALADAGVFRLWLPKIFGGYELTPLQFMEVVEAAAELDGTVGWLVGNGGGMSRAGGYLPEETARAWFADKRAFITSSTGAVGRAVKVEGGYRITGRWPFGSGSSHATHFMVLVSLDVQNQAEHPPFCAFVERKDVAIHDTWHVSGLRGTASCDFEIADVFVPTSLTHAFLVPAGVQPGPLYRFSQMTIFPITVAVVPLGIARNVMKTFRAIAGTTTRLGTTASLRDRETIQDMMGRIEAKFAAARALLASALCDLYDSFGAAGGDDDKLLLRCRLAYTFASETAMDIGKTLSLATGARAIFEDCPIERALRDLNAAAMHIAMSPNNYLIAGRVSLGLDPGVKRL